jgi:F-box/WD-40 domain protein MET30
MLTHLKHYDNQVIASCSIDKTIRLWNVITGECISVLEGHTDKVVSVMFLKKSHISFSKPLLISGSYRELFLWDLKEKKKDINLYGHKEYIWCMIYLNHMSSNFICTG